MNRRGFLKRMVAAAPVAAVAVPVAASLNTSMIETGLSQDVEATARRITGMKASGFHYMVGDVVQFDHGGGPLMTVCGIDDDGSPWDILCRWPEGEGHFRSTLLELVSRDGQGKVSIIRMVEQRHANAA